MSFKLNHWIKKNIKENNSSKKAEEEKNNNNKEHTTKTQLRKAIQYDMSINKKEYKAISTHRHKEKWSTKGEKGKNYI